MSSPAVCIFRIRTDLYEHATRPKDSAVGSFSREYDTMRSTGQSRRDGVRRANFTTGRGHDERYMRKYIHLYICCTLSESGRVLVRRNLLYDHSRRRALSLVRFKTRGFNYDLYGRLSAGFGRHRRKPRSVFIEFSIPQSRRETFAPRKSKPPPAAADTAGLIVNVVDYFLNSPNARQSLLHDSYDSYALYKRLFARFVNVRQGRKLFNSLCMIVVNCSAWILRRRVFLRRYSHTHVHLRYVLLRRVERS